MEDEKATMLWNKLFEMIKLITGEVDVAHRGDLQTQVDTLSETVSECFTSVGDGKKDVANAITGKGVSTEADATFATMAANIRKIKTNPTLQSKSAALHTGATSVVMKPDEGYDGLSQATANITLQEKTAALSTVAQEIVPDSGKVLSKVTVPAVTGNAETSHVLSGKTFSSGNGVNKTGVMANQGAWTGATTGSGNVVIPAGYHNGGGYVSGKGAYDAGYNDGQNAAAGDYQSGYDAGVAATKKGTATEADVLSGKTFTNSNGVELQGSMTDKGAWTGETTGNGNVIIPEGYHNGSGYVSGQGAYDAGYSAGQNDASISTADFSVTINSGTDSPVKKTIDIKSKVSVYKDLKARNFAFTATSCRQDGTGQQYAGDGTWNIDSYNASTGILTVIHYRNGTQNNNNASATVRCYYN